MCSRRIDDKSLKECVTSLASKYPKHLVICHINAQSLNDSVHRDEFQEIFANGDMDVIGVSETFFKPNTYLELEKYNVFSVSRKYRAGGGVAVYVRKCYKSKILAKSQGESFRPEYIILEVDTGMDKVLIATIYRPPKVGFMEMFIEDMYMYMLKYKLTIVCGDINAGIGRNTSDNDVILEAFRLCSLELLNFEDTYHTATCSSVLDTIATNYVELVKDYGQIHAPEFSHHDAVYAVFQILKPPPTRNIFMYRSLYNFCASAFAAEAETIPWEKVCLEKDINSKLECFNKLFMDLVDKHAPLKVANSKRYATPWMTKDLLKLMKSRNNARKRYAKLKTGEAWESFRVLRNIVKMKLKEAKIKYYHGLFSDSKGTKEMWRSIRSLIGQQSNTFSADLITTANNLNLHYLNVGRVSSEEVIDETIRQYKCPDLPYDKFHFKYVTQSDIGRVITDISSKAVGVDNVSNIFLKYCIHSVLPVLEHIINFSLQNGTFPDLWKKANIIPIPKVKQPQTCKDLRPVSILCVLSKVIEKLVHSQVSDFLKSNNILHPLQSGFKKGHSTVSALVKVTDDLKKSMDDRLVSILTLLDFSKAFDCVHHRLLIHKLRCIGFSESVLCWFISYLSERMQRVVISNFNISEWEQILFGVPQGSVLGPLLFILYINDLPTVIKFCKIHMYADDVQLYISSKVDNIENLIMLINTDIQNVVDFTLKHNLSMNAGKTQPIIIGTRRYINQLDSQTLPKIQVLGESVNYCESVCSLGVHIDQTLSWDVHAMKVIHKVFSTLAQIRRNACCLPIGIRKVLVQSLIFSYFDYGAAVMVGMSSTLNCKMQRAQNACVRFVFGVRRDEHITPYYVKGGWLKLQERRKLQLALLAINVVKNQKPSYLLCNLVFVSTIHSRISRQSKSCLQVPQHRTVIFKYSFAVFGAQLWNDLKLYDYLNRSLQYTKSSLYELLINVYTL